MEPSQTDQPHTLCPKCNNFILTPNFLIHEARCKGNNLQSSTYMRNSRMSNQRNSNNLGNANNGEQQRIPCPYCGYGQTFAQLDTHPNVCPHRQVQCSLCHMKFPLSLMDQHQIVCPSKQRSLPSRPQQQIRNNAQRNRNINNERRPNINPQPQPQVRPAYQNRNQHQIRNNQVYPELRPYRNEQQMRPNNNNRRQQNRNEWFQQQNFFQNNQNHNRNRMDQDQIPSGFFRVIDRRRPNNLFQAMLNGLGGLQTMQNNDPFQRRMRVVMIDPGELIALLARRARGSGQSGLTKEQINKFPITKYKNHPNSKKEDEDMCAICFCNFEEDQNCMNLSCKHKFHPDCIGKWLEKNPTCPLCKKNFKGDQQRQRQRQNGQRGEQNFEMPQNMFFFPRINLG